MGIRVGIDGNSHVTIFFKNGRNSIMDRKRLLPAIETWAPQIADSSDNAPW